MSPEPSSFSLAGSSRLLVSIAVVIGFTVLVSGGIAFIFGINFLGEALVLAGVFLFAFTSLCWVAARRNREK